MNESQLESEKKRIQSTHVVRTLFTTQRASISHSKYGYREGTLKKLRYCIQECQQQSSACSEKVSRGSLLQGQCKASNVDSSRVSNETRSYAPPCLVREHTPKEGEDLWVNNACYEMYTQGYNLNGAKTFNAD